MKYVTLTINDVKVPLKLTFDVISKIQETYKIPTIKEAIVFGESVFHTDEYEKIIQVLCYMSEEKLSYDDVGRWLFDNMHELPNIIKKLMDDATDATPTEDTPGK